MDIQTVTPFSMPADQLACDPTNCVTLVTDCAFLGNTAATGVCEQTWKYSLLLSTKDSGGALQCAVSGLKLHIQVNIYIYIHIYVYLFW